ncbi:MAG TPA: hypothetical protein VGC07_03320 [Granulicella sp.]
MSDQIRAEIYGSAALRLKNARRDLSHIEVELAELGRNMEAHGKLIQEMRGNEISRDLVDHDADRLWDLVDKQQGLSVQVALAEAEMTKLDADA